MLSIWQSPIKPSRNSRSMVGQCLALRPDVIVIFAGNNWRTQLTDRDIPYVDSLLRKEGVPGMKSFLDEQAEHAVAAAYKPSERSPGLNKDIGYLGCPGVQFGRLERSGFKRAPPRGAG